MILLRFGDCVYWDCCCCCCYRFGCHFGDTTADWQKSFREVLLSLIWLLPVPLEPTWQTVSVTSFFFSLTFDAPLITPTIPHSWGFLHTGQPENQFIMYHFCFLFAFAESVSTLLNGNCLTFLLLFFSFFFLIVSFESQQPASERSSLK